MDGLGFINRFSHFYVYFPFHVDHVRMIFRSSYHSLVSNDARPVYCFFDDVSNDDHMRMNDCGDAGSGYRSFLDNVSGGDHPIDRCYDIYYFLRMIYDFCHFHPVPYHYFFLFIFFLE